MKPRPQPLPPLPARNVAILIRSDVVAEVLQPGEYARRGSRISISCPYCGGVSALPDEHQVEDGTVDRVWTCPACPWWGWLELAGWA